MLLELIPTIKEVATFQRYKVPNKIIQKKIKNTCLLKKIFVYACERTKQLNYKNIIYVKIPQKRN